MKADPNGANWNRLTTVSKEYWYWPVFLGDTNTVVYGYTKNVSTTPFQLHCYLGGENIPISNCWPAAVEELELKAEMYPNPTDNYFELVLREDFVNLTINLIDLQGRATRINRVIREGSTTRINTAHLVSGIYTVEILSGGNLIARGRVIVQH